MICRGCGNQCMERPDEKNGIAIACPICEEAGCEHCNYTGRMEIETCPREFVGRKMTSAINFASYAEKGHWPILGGTLDQSAWFMDLYHRLVTDTHRIDSERLSRGK